MPTTFWDGTPVTDTRVVLVTAPNEDVAARLCRALLEERLIACGNILPGARSLYLWEGMIHDERECLIVLKTQANRTAELVGRIPGLHPYEVPEVLVLRVDEGHAPYVDWVASATVPGPEGAAE